MFLSDLLLHLGDVFGEEVAGFFRQFRWDLAIEQQTLLGTLYDETTRYLPHIHPRYHLLITGI